MSLSCPHVFVFFFVLELNWNVNADQILSVVIVAVAAAANGYYYYLCTKRLKCVFCSHIYKILRAHHHITERSVSVCMKKKKRWPYGGGGELIVSALALLLKNILRRLAAGCYTLFAYRLPLSNNSIKFNMLYVSSYK